MHKENYVLFKELLAKQARDRRVAKKASQLVVATPSKINTTYAEGFEGYSDESLKSFYAELLKKSEKGEWGRAGLGHVNILPFCDFFR